MAVTVPRRLVQTRISARLIRDHDVKNAIVFCNRKRDVDVVPSRFRSTASPRQPCMAISINPPHAHA